MLTRDPFEAALLAEQSPMLTRDPFEAALLAEQSREKSPKGETKDAQSPSQRPFSATAEKTVTLTGGGTALWFKRKAVENGEDSEEDEDEDRMETCLHHVSSGDSPDRMAKLQEIISQFTAEQMDRYESFRRSGFKKAKMMKFLTGLMGTQKITDHMSITVSAISKMFVGDLVETARIVMRERNERGPIRPCHVREAYRRLKLEGKIPRKSVPRLFR